MKNARRQSSDPQLQWSELTGPAPRLFTVAALTALIRDTLRHALPETLHVAGQISNYKLHKSGHVYFTLKDETSEISCVMWRTAVQSLRFTPEDGLEVLVTAALDVYERAGRYQLYVRKIEPRGVGALELAFRQRVDKLRAEGLFDPARKKPIPPIPQRIAVITSPTGAAIRDILATLKRRFPLAEVIMAPVRVQGDSAAAEVIAALASVHEWSRSRERIDVIIVGRGGGSIEDLWAFNDEALARCLAASLIPVISAVGHETDVTICDLVADVRAATPTAAAELAVPDARELLRQIDHLHKRMHRRLHHALALARAGLDGLLKRAWFMDPFMMVTRRSQRVEDAADAMLNHWVSRARRLVDRLRTEERRLHFAEPRAVTERGKGRLQALVHRLVRAMDQRIGARDRAMQRVAARLGRIDLASRLERNLDRISALGSRLDLGVIHRVDRAAFAWAAQRTRLEAMGYRATLKRGFTITRKQSGTVIRAGREAAPGELLITETSAGHIHSRVEVAPPQQGMDRHE